MLLYVCMYVCVYVCICICVYVCMCLYMCVCVMHIPISISGWFNYGKPAGLIVKLPLVSSGDGIKLRGSCRSSKAILMEAAQPTENTKIQPQMDRSEKPP